MDVLLVVQGITIIYYLQSFDDEVLELHAGNDELTADIPQVLLVLSHLVHLQGQQGR